MTVSTPASLEIALAEAFAGSRLRLSVVVSHTLTTKIEH